MLREECRFGGAKEEGGAANRASYYVQYILDVLPSGRITTSSIVDTRVMGVKSRAARIPRVMMGVWDCVG